MLRLFPATAAVILTAAVAFSQERPGPYGGRAQNFARAGWFVVDGRFARPQAEFAADALFTLANNGNRLSLWAQPTARAEPLLRNYRTALVRLTGSDFVWKLSCPGRTWTDTRGEGTQHLLLAAVPETIRAGKDLRLTKIEITPTQQVAQAVMLNEHDEPVSVIVVFGRDFVEAAVGPFDKPPATLIRSTDAYRLKLERPVEVRTFVAPLLKLLNRGQDPLAAGAGDTYRAFPDLPLDADADTGLRKLLGELTAPDPAARQRAAAALHVLGRRGVQAAMRIDPNTLPPEAAERIASVIAAAAHDDRPASTLRMDPNFLLDCLRDPDPNVRAAAERLVGGR